MPYGACDTAHGFESHLGVMPKGPNPKHTACRRGTKVLLKFVDGGKAVDIFLDRKGGMIHLQQLGKVSKKDLRSFTVYKEQRA